MLFQHFFWFYSHPAVYIMIVPGIGDHLRAHPDVLDARRSSATGPSRSRRVAIALIGFLVWGHHMFVSGQSDAGDTIFSFLTFLVAIPSAVKVFNWIATLYKGIDRSARRRCSTRSRSSSCSRSAA